MVSSCASWCILNTSPLSARLDSLPRKDCVLSTNTGTSVLRNCRAARHVARQRGKGRREHGGKQGWRGGCGGRGAAGGGAGGELRGGGLRDAAQQGSLPLGSQHHVVHSTGGSGRLTRHDAHPPGGMNECTTPCATGAPLFGFRSQRKANRHMGPVVCQKQQQPQHNKNHNTAKNLKKSPSPPARHGPAHSHLKGEAGIKGSALALPRLSLGADHGLSADEGVQEGVGGALFVVLAVHDLMVVVVVVRCGSGAGKEGGSGGVAVACARCEVGRGGGGRQAEGLRARPLSIGHEGKQSGGGWGCMQGGCIACKQHAIILIMAASFPMAPRRPRGRSCKIIMTLDDECTCLQCLHPTQVIIECSSSRHAPLLLHHPPSACSRMRMWPSAFPLPRRRTSRAASGSTMTTMFIIPSFISKSGPVCGSCRWIHVSRCSPFWAPSPISIIFPQNQCVPGAVGSFLPREPLPLLSQATSTTTSRATAAPTSHISTVFTGRGKYGGGEVWHGDRGRLQRCKACSLQVRGACPWPHAGCGTQGVGSGELQVMPRMR